MRIRLFSCSARLAVSALFAACHAASAQFHYAALDLGIPFSGFQKELAINNNGWIAGVTRDGGFNRAFVFDGAATTIFGTFGGSTSAADAINNLGVIAGRAGTGTGASHGFHHVGPPPLNPATDDIGTLGGSTSVANGTMTQGWWSAGRRRRAASSTPFSTTAPCTTSTRSAAGSAARRTSMRVDRRWE